jgi:hypothetical protein
MTGHFAREALDQVAELFAEGQKNPLQGECNQKAKREAAKQPRTPEQMQADQARAQNQRGKDNIPSATRSEAARRAAETRKRCAGGGSTT